jgi:hypothetical protein
MRTLAQLVLTILVLCLFSFTAGAQSGDTTVIDKFITRQAAREKGEEPEGIRKTITGDLNHDGVADTAVLYTIEGQNGSNNYVQYLAVFVRRQGRLVYAARTLIGGKGHRSIELTEIKDNVILFDTTGYASQDPSCCPTIKGRTSYLLVGKRLEEKRPRAKIKL